jgi:hypothetical protein
VKDANVPIAMFVGRHDKMSTVNDSHKTLATLNGYFGSFPVVHFEERDGGLESFLVGKDMSYMEKVVDLIHQYNPHPALSPKNDIPKDKTEEKEE